jgi:TetR/AcrR family transcriptional repressor of nem operon
MRKGEQTRQEIIRKAAPIFNQKGYEGAALSALMEATGLEKGGVYRHFDSRQQLAADPRRSSDAVSEVQNYVFWAHP